MRKLLLALGLLILPFIAAEASMIRWSVDDSDDIPGSLGAWCGFRLVAIDGDGNESLVNFYNQDESGESTWVDSGYAELAKGEVGVATLDSLGDLMEYSFTIEILNWESAESDISVVTRSETWTYSKLVNQGYIDTGASLQPSMEAWHGGSYSDSVPEPTSGLLVALGLAALALRRRRTVVG